MTASEVIAECAARGIPITVGPGPRLPQAEPLPPAKAASRKPATSKRLLVEAMFAPPATWTIPVETASEANGRDWRKRSKRSDGAWRAVSRAMGPELRALAAFAEAFHDGFPIRVQFTRIGGRRLDRSNLPTALKAVEDAVAFMLGADDGSPLWCAEWQQRPGGDRVGVMVRFLTKEAT